MSLTTNWDEVKKNFNDFHNSNIESYLFNGDDFIDADWEELVRIFTLSKSKCNDLSFIEFIFKSLVNAFK